MKKTIHQEVAEFLEGRVKTLETETEHFAELTTGEAARVRMLIARELGLLAAHLHFHVASRGLAVPPEEEKPGAQS